ncbi:MAG: 3-dehydroquinate dehydratase [Kiritimatiellae bacterium]|nr:3-dehydroquinate dehydratase [Kiritimatiellia bacterium]
MKIIIINGPNLNLLGTREPELYGNATYQDLVEFCRKSASELGVEVDIHQSNHEGVLIELIHAARGWYDAIVINAAGYTHTSVAILDALKAVNLPVAEVHLTEPKEREEFRKFSFIGMVAEKTFSGMGFNSYSAALEYFAAKGAN